MFNLCVFMCGSMYTHTCPHVYALVDKFMYVHIAYVIWCWHLCNDDVSMLS